MLLNDANNIYYKEKGIIDSRITLFFNKILC